MPSPSRRDFLKIAAVTSASLALSRYLPWKQPSHSLEGSSDRNVIILVFDAMSARHLSVYGYPRKTTPNFERFAGRANVYHAHYSPGNYTVPGVSSLLTGLHPWTHRAVNLSGLVARDLADRNIFERLDARYHRFAFSQNVWATNILTQFENGIDEFLPSSAFSQFSMVASEAFPNDPRSAHQAYDDFMFDFIDSPASLGFGLAERFYFEQKKKRMFERKYPRGIPQPRNYPLVYKLDQVFDGIIETLETLEQPFFAYIHVFSPHAPYRARRDFVGIFDNGWNPTPKPEHVFSEGETEETVQKNRIWYDEYIANVDDEFGRLLDSLEKSGVLGKSYLMVTSDHGELIERGVKGHVTPLMYEPLVNIPLLVSTPGQVEGKQIHTPTSSVDILPTILKAAGHEIPTWVEGQLLPEFGSTTAEDRPIYMMDAKSGSSFGKFSTATFAMRKGKYKIILYRGYKAYEEDAFEVYNLENDPEELDDLVLKNDPVVVELKSELLKKFDEVNKAHVSA
ncbi:MAG: sulfatase-like hydrolase/transferase [Chloroflexi bacterium]|nr:sulfatase-like hydrolase/transferase [Chloroflexota bacterium]